MPIYTGEELLNMNTSGYEEGLKAASEGKIPTDSPYPKGTVEHTNWLEGLIDGSL